MVFAELLTLLQVACQQPKPILLDVGQMDVPYDWSPNIVDMQLLRVGQFIIIVSPSEATTMSGRRWKNAVYSGAVDNSITEGIEPIVVLGAPGNTYAHYLTTEQEYGVQRYEGASTLYGQYELQAYINVTVGNIGYLSPDSTTSPPTGPLPPNNVNISFNFITGVVYDTAPLGYSFGEVIDQPAASYSIGDVINATFIGADPRNNLRLGDTFSAVEMLVGSTWTQVRDDSDWDLVYTWYREDVLLGTSNVVISWETSYFSPAPGTYRILYNGDSKEPVLGTITAFQGISDSFTLS